MRLFQITLLVFMDFMDKLPAFEFNPEVAVNRLKNVVNRTPLQYNARLSARYSADVFLKREDLQVVRSYKLRGAYNKLSGLPAEQLKNGAVCASAGNHAQGFAYSCKRLNVRGVIFMPGPTPKQKISQTEMFGEGQVEIKLVGDTFDDCMAEALKFTKANNMKFIPPFDDPAIIEGQATVGVEILEDLPDTEIIVVPVGGGGLLSGIGSYVRMAKPSVQLVAVEPEGAASLNEALHKGHPVTLQKINSFIDGAAVKRVGDLPFEICRKFIKSTIPVPEGKVCTSILRLYNEDAIVAEPAGALSIAALDFIKDSIRGKKVVCIVSGGNNDIDRMAEIKEMSLLYEGYKHYFIIKFPQRPGALKLFVNDVLGPGDDITRFEFIKKTERERGPALVGIELRAKEDYNGLLERMKLHRFDFKEVNKDKTLFEFLI